ncbi:MAG: Clp protease N-terminal domain-containing protein [Dehalococcoidales bacterium]|nr:Clp protease N-terminal domain-containing protein [Dehalococcoidales bacterium]
MALDNLSPEVKKILALARHESEGLRHYYLGVEHIFIALTKMDSGVMQRILGEIKIDPKQLRDSLRYFIGLGDGHRYWDGTVITPRCQLILELAREEAEKDGEDSISTKSLLIAIFKEGEGIPVRVLEGLGFQAQNILEMINDSTVQVAFDTATHSTCDYLVQFSVIEQKFKSGGRNN